MTKRNIVLFTLKEHKKIFTQVLSRSPRINYSIPDLLILLDDIEDKTILMMDDMLLSYDGHKPKGSNDATKSNTTSSKSKMDR